MIVDCLSNTMLDLLDTQIMLTFTTLHNYQLLCKMLVIGENLGIAIGETQKYYLIVTFYFE
jgi:hypothetical protein